MPRLESLESRTLLAAGTLDPTFGQGGLQTIDFLGQTKDTAADMVLTTAQDDGKIVVAGTVLLNNFPTDRHFGVVRYNADGALDGSFGQDGRVVTSISNTQDFVSGVAVQDDGKIIVAGTSLINGSFDFSIVRYNVDGSLDASFGGDGRVTTDFGFFDSGEGIAIQADGKIVLAGSSNADFALARYNPDGTLDTQFDMDGKVTMDLGGFDVISDLAIHEGKIIVAGRSNSDLVLARYSSDGSLDPTFNEDGLATIIEVQNPRDMLIDDMGRIVVNAGFFTLARFNGDGTFDEQFGTGGIVTRPFATAGSVAIQSDGKLVIPGSLDSDFAVARYTDAGVLDDTFAGGLVTTDFGGGETARGVAIRNDGKIVVVGSATVAGGLLDEDFAVAQYNTHGTLDGSFGNGGKVTTNLGLGKPQSDLGNVAAVQADGKIVVAGSTEESFFAIARRNPDGTLDASFGNDGRVTTRFLSDAKAEPASVLIQDDGKILMVGTVDRPPQDFGQPNSLSLAIARFNSDGSQDTTFTRVFKFFGSGLGSVFDARIDPDGKISIIAGSSNGLTRARYNADGTPDETLGPGGVATTPLPAGNFSTGVFAPDGKIAVSGWVGSFNAKDIVVARYNSDGTPDTTFSQDGFEVTDFDSSNEEPADISVQSDGRIVIAGVQDDPALARRDLLVARYQNDGELDGDFAKKGWTTVDLGGWEEAASVAIQPGGKIVVAGSAQATGSSFVSDFLLVRYKSDGTLDDRFSGGVVVTDFGFSDEANSITLQPDGKLLVTGSTRLRSADSGFALARYEGVSNEDLAITQLVAVIGEVQDLVDTGVLNQGQGNALLSKLQGAIQQIDNDKTGAATNKLEAFVNQVEDYVDDGTLTSDQGQELIDSVQVAIALLSDDPVLS